MVEGSPIADGLSTGARKGAGKAAVIDRRYNSRFKLGQYPISGAFGTGQKNVASIFLPRAARAVAPSTHSPASPTVWSCLRC